MYDVMPNQLGLRRHSAENITTANNENIIIEDVIHEVSVINFIYKKNPLSYLFV